MIAVSFSQIDGWVSFVYLAAVVAVTIRLLRNLDAFSLEIEPVPSAPEAGEEIAETGSSNRIADRIAEGEEK